MKPATKLPWDTLSPKGRTIIGNGGQTLVCDMADAQDVADEYSNAAYIVHACNAYPRLVEALKSAIGSAMCDRSVEDSGIRSASALLRELGES